MWLAFKEIRKSTMAAISSGVVIRFSSGILATTLFSFSCGAGKVEPLLIEWRHHFGGDDGVYPDAIREELGRPLPSHPKDSALGRNISRRAALTRKSGFRTDVHDRATASLQVRHAVVRHVVVMQQIALERAHKLFGTAVLEADLVIDASVVHQCIDVAETRKRLFDDLVAIVG